MLRAMEYEFPGEGAEKVIDQFMLGSKLLVAPQTDRALPAQELKARLAGLRPEFVAESCAGVAEGLAAALESTPEGETIYVGGSAFVVAEALAALKTM